MENQLAVLVGFFMAESNLVIHRNEQEKIMWKIPCLDENNTLEGRSR